MINNTNLIKHITKRLLLLSVALLFTLNLKAQIREVKNDTISIINSSRYDSIHYIVIENLKKLEGLKLNVYQSSVGNKTIGYGHQSKNLIKNTITIDEADSILNEDFEKSVVLVISQTKFRKNNNPEKLLALASFVFNIGGELFLRSTLLSHIKKNVPLKSIKIQFNRWIYYKSKGKKIISLNLKRMRDFEFNLYSGKIK